MAALSATQFEKVAVYGVGEGYAIYAISGVTTGDTIDCSAEFNSVKLAGVIFGTTAKGGRLTTITGNVITIDITGLVADGGILTVWGALIA